MLVAVLLAQQASCWHAGLPGALHLKRAASHVAMTHMFPLSPESTYADCLTHSSHICEQVQASAFDDAEIHLGPMAAFLCSSNAADILSQLQAADEPLGDVLVKEARALRFALLQRLTALNSLSALQRLAALKGKQPLEIDVARWNVACDVWGYEAEELEDLLDKLEPSCSPGESSA